MKGPNFKNRDLAPTATESNDESFVRSDTLNQDDPSHNEAQNLAIIDDAGGANLTDNDSKEAIRTLKSKIHDNTEGKSPTTK